MGTILALNPRGSGKHKKGAKTMPKKKKKGGGTKRKNPRTSAAAMKAYSRAKTAIEAVSLKKAGKQIPSSLGGILAAKFGANQLSENGGDDEQWDKMAFLGAGLGAYAGGLIAETIKSGAGQRTLNAGIAYTPYKLIKQKGLTKWEWGNKYFGEEATIHPDYEQYDDPGDVLLGADGGQYVLTDNGWRDIEDRDRMMGQAVVPATAQLGQAVVPASNRLGAEDSGGLFRRGNRRSIWH